MSPTDELVPVLKKLRLSGVMQTMDLRIRQAVEDDLSHVEFLLRLLTDEVERRESKQTALRLRRADFEHSRTLEDFDFHFNPAIPKAKILDLATCAFIDRKENLFFAGRTGTGKSHLAQAIGHRACMAGHKVLFVAAHKMLADLRAARADRTLERRMLRYTTPDLLIIDDLGLRPLKDQEPLDLYDVIRGRYERTSTLVTSNRAVDELYPLFGDPLLASAAMDRLLHHSEVIEIDGKSFRTGARS